MAVQSESVESGCDMPAWYGSAWEYLSAPAVKYPKPVTCVQCFGRWTLVGPSTPEILSRLREWRGKKCTWLVTVNCISQCYPRPRCHNNHDEMEEYRIIK